MAVLAAQGQVILPGVKVGNAGNANDPATGNLYGGVSYEYYIGQYEVTNGQYAAFLNSVAATDTHGLYNPNMGALGGIMRSGSPGGYSYTLVAGRENRPVNFVSFWDAARFTNWLTNGQPNGGQMAGTTETGVYNLGGVKNPVNNTITRDMTVWNSGGVAIASENEWYKAAYYDPAKNGGLGGYWIYPTQSNTQPSNDLATPDPGNNANFLIQPSDFTDPANKLTEVGAFENSASAYGTFDQGGNVLEWNDTIYDISARGQLGGSYTHNHLSLRASGGNSGGTNGEGIAVGFRVSSLAPLTVAEIPEPAQVGGLAVGVLGLWILRRRGGRGKV